MKRNKTNGNGKRYRFKGKEHVLIPRLAAFGVVRSVRRIDGLGAVLVVDLDNGLSVAMSPLDVECRRYQGC